MSPDEQIIRLVEALSTLAIAWQGKKLIPLLRVHVRIALDTRKKLRRLEAAHDQERNPDGTHRPRTPTPHPDELELAAQRAIDDTAR